jgi:glycosyltransferase involved in cell wall biosynthesis
LPSHTICVYAIMRDEAHNVDEWVHNVRDADHVFVLDTGSQDGTLDYLNEFKVEIQSAVFEPFRFDDARNTALALAPPASLYLRLDADERLPEDWRDQLSTLPPDTRRARFRVRAHPDTATHSLWGQHTRDDLHARNGFRWQYPTHEVLTGPPPSCDLPDFIITHLGAPFGTKRSHHLSNLQTLLDAVVEYPDSARMRFYLARELVYRGDWNSARAQLTLFLSTFPNHFPAERAEAFRLLASIDFNPERWLLHAIAESPERREPFSDLARLYLKLDSPVRALSFYHEARLRTDDSLYTTDPQAWGQFFDELGADIYRALDPSGSHSLDPGDVEPPPIPVTDEDFAQLPILDLDTTHITDPDLYHDPSSK